MPVGRDLGFASAVVLVVALIAFEVRRRWRRSVARGEEVRRLVARVAEEEEAAWADFEASVHVAAPPRSIQSDLRPIQFDRGPKQSDSRPLKLDTGPIRLDARRVQSDSRPVQYQCALCFSPATTRCAKCKAARYCSGKCQILHWRRGHKNECRPFTSPCELRDVGGGSSPMVSLRQEGCEIYRNSDSKGSQSAESVQKSELNASPADSCGNRADEAKCIADGGRQRSSSDETDKQNGHHSANEHFAPLGKPNQIKSGNTNHNVLYGRKGSSNRNADGTTEISISDPYIPFSGFWERTVSSSASNIDSNYDLAQPSSPFKFNDNLDPSTVVKGSGNATVNLGAAHSTTLGMKKSVEVDSLSDEECECGSPSCSGKSDAIHTCNTGNVVGSKSKETSRAVGSSISACTRKGSSMKPLSPQKANPVIHGTRVIVDPTVSDKDEIVSNPSVVNLSSIAGRHSFQCAKTGKDDSIRASDVTYFKFPSSSPNSKNGFKTSMLKVVDQLRVSKSLRQSGFMGEITGRYNEKGLFPYELFVKLYNWKKVELPQPCGFLNCGNSCYANAVLQCLACTPPLTVYLLQRFHSKACKWKEWCFTCEFESLMWKAKAGDSPLSPATMLTHIYKIRSHFGNGKEEDAHEFLRYVIDTMQSASLREVGVRASGSSEEETTLMGLTFGGYLRSKIKCMKCGAKSEQCERMMDLTIEIEGNVGTLDEALRKFTSTEILDGENKYQCSRCRSYERAKKKFRVLEAPNILIIALKRFQPGPFGKLNKWIQFPEILDLAPYMSGTSDKSPIYKLYGVIIHLDSMNATYSGHYLCFVKNAENKWFEIDDSRVKPVDLESVLANRAYMLLYARCSPRAPRLIRNLVTRDLKKSRGPPVKSRSHSMGSRNGPTTDPLNDHHNGIESFHPNDVSFQSVQTVFEEDSSENASSIFSEECSCSTESSNRDYSSTDDHFDSIFSNFGNERISSWRNSSDSESSSSSSSFASLKSSVKILNSDSTKQSRKLGGSSSCRETHSSRLGWANPFGSKKPGLLFRRLVRERAN